MLNIYDLRLHHGGIRNKMSSEEDIILSFTYMVVNKDCKINTSQIRSKLWKKLAIKYNQRKPNENEIYIEKIAVNWYNASPNEVTLLQLKVHMPCKKCIWCKIMTMILWGDLWLLNPPNSKPIVS
jgi:hypothetical protein